MAVLRALISLAAITMVVGSAMAANYTVGGPSGGWDQSTNLQSWSSSKTFLVGDNLIFAYSPLHDVNEVSKADYDSCQTSSPMSTNSGGNTVIPLTTPGKRYFICGTMGHCSMGMKLEVNVLQAKAAPPPSTSSSVPPSPSIVPPAAAPAPADSPVNSPAPIQSRKAQSPSPMLAPETAPVASPSEATDNSPVEPLTPAASPPALDFPSGIEPSGGARELLPPPPSSADRISAVATSAVGFGVIFVMLAL